MLSYAESERIWNWFRAKHPKVCEEWRKLEQRPNTDLRNARMEQQRIIEREWNSRSIGESMCDTMSRHQ